MRRKEFGGSGFRGLGGWEFRNRVLQVGVVVSWVPLLPHSMLPPLGSPHNYGYSRIVKP